MRTASLMTFVALSLSPSLFIAACSSDDDPSASDEFVQDYCALMMPCCVQAGLSGDPSSCKAMLGWAAAGGTFDPAKADQCLAATRAASSSASFCTLDFDTNGACEDVYVQPGGAAPGAACDTSSDCADSAQGDGFCMSSYDGQMERSVCVAVAPGSAGDGPCVGTKRGSVTSYSFGSGAPPASGYVCDEGKGSYCDDTSQRCEALVAQGGACTYATPCVKGSYCDSGSQRCAAKLPAGASCTDGQTPCDDGLYCEPGSKTCVAQLANGAACTSYEQCVGGQCTNGACHGSTNIGLAFLCGGG